MYLQIGSGVRQGPIFYREKREILKIYPDQRYLFISFILQNGSSQPFFYIFVDFGEYYLYGE